MAIIRHAARRYADAIFSLASADGTEDAWASDLERLAALLEVPLAEKALTSPAVPANRKLAVIDTELPGLQPQTRNLLQLLLHRDRLELLPDIAVAFRERLNQAHGIAIALVTTAVPLDDAARQQLAARLARFVGKQVQIQATVDPSIMGGVVAQIGDLLLDGSVRGRLEALRRRLAATGTMET